MKIDRTALVRYAPAIVALAAVAVYINSIANGFSYDDVYIIQENPRVLHLLAWRDIWLTPYWPTYGTELGLYRPFVIFMYAVEWAIGGGAPWVFHATNVGLHALASVLAFLLLERLTNRTAALVGGLLFAVHPLHTEAVANMVGQAELIASITLFGGCLLHVSRPAPMGVSWPRRILLVALFGVGLAAKESAVVLPGLLIALDFAQHRVRFNRRELTAYLDAMLMPILLLGATLALYLIMRFDALSGALIGLDAAPTLPYLHGDHRILNALRAFPEFVRLLFFPLDLSADYSPGIVLPVESVTMMTLLGGLLLAGLVAVALMTPWRPAAGLPAAWFLICISPVSNLFFPIGVLIAERTLYVPSFAASLVVAYAWCAAPHVSERVRRLAPAVAAIAIVLLGVRTWVRNPDWDTTPTIFASLLREHPQSYKAQWFYATLLWKRNETAAAGLHYELGYRIYQRDSQFLVEYANYLMDQGRVRDAIPLLERSYAMHPFIPRTIMLLADAYLRVGRYDDALKRAGTAERYGAYRISTMPLRARAYTGLGQHANAVGAWRVTLQHTTGNPWVVWAFIARSLALSGDPEQARAAVDHGRAATTDSAAHAVLERLRGAIAGDCYAPAPAGQVKASANFVMPACDPLGDYQTPKGPAQPSH